MAPRLSSRPASLVHRPVAKGLRASPLKTSPRCFLSVPYRSSEKGPIDVHTQPYAEIHPQSSRSKLFAELRKCLYKTTTSCSLLGFPLPPWPGFAIPLARDAMPPCRASSWLQGRVQWISLAVATRGIRISKRKVLAWGSLSPQVHDQRGQKGRRKAS